MKRQFRFSYMLIFAVAASLLAFAAAGASADFPDPPGDSTSKVSGTRTAVLAGGCFWGMEAVFERLRGVTDVISGYSGGDAQSASYESVSTGQTGHAESIRIRYDPSQISFRTLLKVFFSVAHDPTQFNYQGPDHGSQYRSVIFYVDAGQKRTAEDYIGTLNRAGVFRSKIVTQVVPMNAFYPAEEYHQDFIDRHPFHPYVVRWDLPKIAHLEKEFPGLVVSR